MTVIGAAEESRDRPRQRDLAGYFMAIGPLVAGALQEQDRSRRRLGRKTVGGRGHGLGLEPGLRPDLGQGPGE
jgi:hypothetical protein